MLGINFRKHVNPAIQSKITALLTSLFLFTGCQQEEAIQVDLPAFDGERAFAEIAELVKISPRDAGTPEGKQAAEHIYNRLNEVGVSATIETFKDRTPAGEKTFNNVIGRIPGKTDRWIILGSHFDTMPGIDNFQGANDSGSSTGVLIELSRMLANKKMDTGLIFIFFDGEEGIAEYRAGDGLHGSRYKANKMREAGELNKIKAMVLLDMVGDKNLGFTIPYNSSQKLVKELLAAAHATGHRDLFSLARQINITDDHQPFLDLEVPAINIIDFHFGSAPGLNDYWHTPADNLESISAKSLAICGDVVIQLLYQIDQWK